MTDATNASEDLALIMAVREASRAITCLYLEAPEAVVNDVRAKVEEAFKAYQLALAARECAVWEECERYFDALQDEECPLTAGQLIFHFQEYCHQQAEAVKP